jgi:hypothetical protein
LAFSYWIDKPWFLTEGKLAVVLITPSLGVPNWSVIYIINTAPPWGIQLTLKFSPLIMDAFIAHILDDQVMHDHTSSHDLPHHLYAPCPCRVANNIPPILEHTQCMLHILSACLLSHGKPSIFLIR